MAATTSVLDEFRSVLAIVRFTTTTTSTVTILMTAARTMRTCIQAATSVKRRLTAPTTKCALRDRPHSWTR